MKAGITRGRLDYFFPVIFSPSPPCYDLQPHVVMVPDLRKRLARRLPVDHGIMLGKQFQWISLMQSNWRQAIASIAMK